MAYVDTEQDRRLREWFKNDKTCATLHSLKLNGSIRGLKNTSMDFSYPIAGIAGKNGCGKTTLLAIAACAYHNTGSGFKTKSRKNDYYTFSDFFIQTHEENKLGGVEIWYKFLHDNWKNAVPGFGHQKMHKRNGGKWNRYEKRINKNVVFLGIDRVVPQTEKQVYKSYVKYFTDDVAHDWLLDVSRHVGKILGKSYSQFKLKKAGSYNLQLVKESNNVYSGFNMGAGEKALFELFSLIYQCSNNGTSSLIIVDEIELGLHEVAQRRLIDVLKDICKKKKLQVIFTTHSSTILNALPLDARFFIEKSDDNSPIIRGISGEFAAGRLGERNSDELDIYVEDNIARTLIQSCFTLELRQRIGVISIGSCSAVCRQLSAAYNHPKLKNKTIAVLDGDQRTSYLKLVDMMISNLELSTPAEKGAFKEWIKGKIFFLPGNGNPEKWIIETTAKYADKDFSSRLDLRLSHLKEELNLSLGELAHDEFYYLAEKFSLEEVTLINEFCRFIASIDIEELNLLVDSISEKLR